MWIVNEIRPITVVADVDAEPVAFIKDLGSDVGFTQIPEIFVYSGNKIHILEYMFTLAGAYMLKVVNSVDDTYSYTRIDVSSFDAEQWARSTNNKVSRVSKSVTRLLG